MLNREFWRTGLVAATVLACGGCAGSSGAPPASGSAAQATVKGTVTRKGKPLAGAEIHFNPANVHRRAAPMSTATTRADGSYEITTLIGENTVTLGGRVLGRNTQLQYTARTLDVKEGQNTLDLPLP